MATIRSRSKVEGRRSKVGRRRAAIYRLESVAAKSLACSGCLPDDEVIPQRRKVWLNVTAPESSSLNSDKHRGRIQEKTQSGLRSFPEHRRGFACRNGVPAPSLQGPGALSIPMRASRRGLRSNSTHAAHAAREGRSRRLPVGLHLRPSTFDLRPTATGTEQDLS